MRARRAGVGVPRRSGACHRAVFTTVFGRGLVDELPNFVHRPYLVVTMADLWPRFEDRLAGPSLAGVHLVETLELSELDRLDDAPAAGRGDHRARRRAGHRRREVLRLDAAAAALPGADRDDRQRAIRPSGRVSATTAGPLSRLDRPRGRLHRLRRHRIGAAGPQPVRRRRRPVLPHGPITTGGSPTGSAGRSLAGRTTRAWSPTPPRSWPAVVDALDEIRDGRGGRDPGPRARPSLGRHDVP